MKRNGANLTEGKPVKLILQFAIPVFLGNLFQLFYGLIDTKIVGSTLGEGALAAVGSVSIIVGIALTLPISSAAICAALGLTGLAGGAALAGCCAQMVGFAVASFRENKWGGLFAQGIGTSMLQMGNIVKNPRIWLPATLASAITGPISI